MKKDPVKRPEPEVLPLRVDGIIEKAIFSPDGQEREKAQKSIRDMAIAAGIFPASIQGLYEAAGKGLYHNRTVPAINLRGITYPVARAVFRAAMKNNVGAFIFEIARSEIGYTAQRPAEYATCVLAAASKEGFNGPVFLQGDHFQINRSKYSAGPDKEINAVKDLIQEAVKADFLNIDIDASTLVDLTRPGLEAQQEKNCQVTADMTGFIRSIQPERINISVGGEIGEVGKRNSTIEDLKAFMSGYSARLGPGIKGISKISVQTGTKHGGVVLPDGSIAHVELDFKTLEELSKIAREDYGLGGAVQHGASTLPDEAFDLFPNAGAAEVHLATAFQNMIFDSPYFPDTLLKKINQYVVEQYSSERKPGETDVQFFYENRKRAFGPFKHELWHIPEESLKQITGALENRFVLLFQKLNVVDTVELVNKYVIGLKK